MGQRSTCLWACAYRMYCMLCIFDGVYKKIKNYRLEHAISMQKHYDSWTKSSITLGIRPPLMPSGQGIRAQKWSNPLLCPVGGRWGHDFDKCIMQIVRYRADPGFLKGGFWHTIARKVFRSHAHFWLKPRPFSIVWEKLPVQSGKWKRMKRKTETENWNGNAEIRKWSSLL